jgi:hypothetical protein
MTAPTAHAPRPATTIRPATAADGAALARISALDGRPLGAAPLLVAETSVGLVAALSLTDSTVVSDPLRFTLEEIDLLRAEARRIGDGGSSASPRATRGRLSTVVAGALVAASLLTAALAGASTAHAAPKPGLPAGTWVGSGLAKGETTEAGVTSTFSARLRFTIVVGKDGRVRGTGAFASDMVVTGEFPSVISSTADVTFGGTATNLLYTGTAATRATFDTVTRNLKPIVLRQQLPIGRAGACRVTGSVVLNGLTFTWSAAKKIAGTCRT